MGAHHKPVKEYLWESKNQAFAIFGPIFKSICHSYIDFSLLLCNKGRSRPRKGRQPVTPTDGAGAVPAGGGSSPSLPGDPGIDPAGIMTGARGASLKRDGQGGGNACAQHRVKRGLD
jgi:hypothetical protein